jgi:hypothetical protein
VTTIINHCHRNDCSFTAFSLFFIFALCDKRAYQFRRALSLSTDHHNSWVWSAITSGFGLQKNMALFPSVIALSCPHGAFHLITVEYFRGSFSWPCTYSIHISEKWTYLLHITSWLSLQERHKFLPSSDFPAEALVWLGVMGTSLIAHVESFQDLCVGLSFSGILKTTNRLKTRWVLRTHLLWGHRRGAEALRPWVDSLAEVLSFLTILTPVFPSLYLVT